jgi:hypothetical protein
MLDQKLVDRLTSKSIKQSIVNQISKDFNLTPLLAEAYFNQIKEYFLRHADIDLSSGQLHYLAIDENEPAGKPVSLCKKVSVKLTLHKPEEDFTVYKKSGLHGLRQHKLLRVANEAIEQGAVLSYEDLAFILTTSTVTIKRDMSSMRRQGIILPSRGWRHEMGRGQTHKTQILELYFSGYPFSQIEQRTHHSETAIKRYIQDFAKVALLHQKGFSNDQIRIASGFSHCLIGEYLKLLKQHSQSLQLKRILQNPKKKGD